MWARGIPVKLAARAMAPSRPVTVITSMSTIANFCFPSESTRAVATIPAGSMPAAPTCVCDPQFSFAIPTGGVMSALATPASSPEGAASLTPSSQTAADIAGAAASQPARATATVRNIVKKFLLIS